jgi:hypothetical protein
MPDQAAVPGHVPAVDPSASGKLDRFAVWAIGKPATVILGAASIGMVTIWAINYVFWPMFIDSDHMAMIARDWDLGFKPYRDRFTFQFPGEIYLYWAIGKIAGWGNTVANNVVDVAFVAAFGVWIVAWSRRVFGRALPGMMGFVTFLYYYLALDYSLTNQRDWHLAFYCVLALTIPQLWQGRPGRLLSAAVMGWALVNRPQSFLVFPALAIVGDLSARGENDPWSKTVWAAIEYVFVMTAVFAAFLTPVFAQNLVGAFLDNLKLIGPGTAYSKFNNDEMYNRFVVLPIPVGEFSALLGAILVVGTPTANRRLGTALLLAFIGFSLYGWISPIRVPYHKLPMIVMWSLWIAYLTDLLLAYPLLSNTFRLVLLLFLVVTVLPGKPRQVSVRNAVRTIAALRNGQQPPLSFRPFHGSDEYTFDDYYATIAYIKKNSTTNTKITNMTHRIYEAFHGSTGLASAVFAESHGLYYFPQIADRESKELAAADDAIVVWDPSFKEFREKQPVLVKTIETYYAPEARFGLIEVWRRKAKTARPDVPGP